MHYISSCTPQRIIHDFHQSVSNISSSNISIFSLIKLCDEGISLVSHVLLLLEIVKKHSHKLKGYKNEK